MKEDLDKSEVREKLKELDLPKPGSNSRYKTIDKVESSEKLEQTAQNLNKIIYTPFSGTCAQ